MYEVYFYQDASGNQPVKEYLDRLEEKSTKSKDARINIIRSINILEY